MLGAWRPEREPSGREDRELDLPRRTGYELGSRKCRRSRASIALTWTRTTSRRRL
jgi:hypothetical protein